MAAAEPDARRLVDEHGVHGLDVGPGEALDIVEDARLLAVRKQHIVLEEILDLCAVVLRLDLLLVCKRHVLHHDHKRGWARRGREGEGGERRLVDEEVGGFVFFGRDLRFSMVPEQRSTKRWR